MLCQVFANEITKTVKLVAVDGGTYYSSDNKLQAQIAHIGKIVKSRDSIPKFVKFFTLVFE